MNLDPGEVQILKGRDLTVTDRRVVTGDATLAVVELEAPHLESVVIETPVGPTLMIIGAVIFATGLFSGVMFLIVGAAMVVSGGFAKVKRRMIAVSVEVAGTRKAVYTTAVEKDANLALAALHEALRRRAA